MSTIEWTGETWNPTTGCDRVSPGCDNCYALTMAGRLKLMGSAKYQRDGDPRTSGPGFGLTVHPDTLDAPLRRRTPTTYFVNSMSDLFHKDVPPDFIADVLAVAAVARQHTFQILTKRPQRMAALMGTEIMRGLVDAGMTGKAGGFAHIETDDVGWPIPNVHVGTSIETDRFCFRADQLRATPAAVRFLSLEPLLGPLPSLDLTGIDWVIVGGESGPGARPMHIAWVRDIRDRCVDAGVAFFFKQWGAWGPAGSWQGPDHHLTIDGRLFEPGERLGPDHMAQPAAIHRWGKKAAGRVLDGRTWDEMPTNG